ncbi:MAG: hypothetical protein GY866_17835 [Proteobacteria bacterium]|nr:hypothetical protein [Pseudomonadota bacterium]
MSSAKADILGRLRSSGTVAAEPRPEIPSLPEVEKDTETLVARFIKELELLQVTVFRAGGAEAVRSKLGDICLDQKIGKVLVSSDEVAGSMELESWEPENPVDVVCVDQLEDRTTYKRVSFEEVQAGITGANFGVAETGTLVLAHDKHQARLVSLAPKIHIALLPVERLVPNLEDAMKKLYSDKDLRPSQVTFVTGPSLTGDIGGVLMRGMHGPMAVYVILIG